MAATGPAFARDGVHRPGNHRGGGLHAVLDAGWVYDDVNLVRPSPALHSLAGLGRSIATDLYSQACSRLEVSPYWRPLAMASFWLDTRFGNAPRADCKHKLAAGR